MGGASDYMVGNAPQGASYSAPLVGQQLGEMIASYPQRHFEAQQRQRQLDVMNAFPEGIPMNPDGTPNVSEVVGRLAKAGGGNYVQQLLPFMMQQQGAQAIGKGLSAVNNFVDPPPGANTSPRASTTSTSPAQLAPTGNGAATIRSIAGNDVEGASAAVQAFRVSPTAPLQPAQAQQVKTFLAQRSVPQQPPGAPAGAAPGAAPAQAAPPPAAPGQQPPAVPTPAAQVPVSPPATGGNSVFLPKPKEPEEEANYPLADREANIATMQRLDKAIGALAQQQVVASASGNTAAEAAIKQRIENLQQRRQSIFEYISKGEQVEHEHELSEAATPEKLKIAKQAGYPSVEAYDQAQAQHAHELKEAETPEKLKIAKQAGYPDVASYDRAVEQHKLVDVARDKDAQAYNKMAGQGDEARPQIGMMMRSVNSPGFIAGTGAAYRTTLANLAQTLGLGNNASINQIFDKMRASGILDQIKGLAGTGPVRVAEMKFIDTMMAGRENQPEALRAVLTINDRLYERAQAIRGLIQANHGVIDDNVEAAIQKLISDHPLFRPEEMKDPRALGAPTFGTPVDMHQAVVNGIIKRHDPFWTADNPPRVKYVP